MSRTVRPTDLSASPGAAAGDETGWGVDDFTTEVMCARWRHNTLCAHMVSFDEASPATRESICRRCPVIEPCFWAALIEERAFRTTSGNPPGTRGGVQGGKRRFILRELTDTEIIARYRHEAWIYNDSHSPTTCAQPEPSSLSKQSQAA
jgi:hypothetical protein